MRKRPGPLTRFFIRFDMVVCGLVLPFSVWQAVTVDWTLIFGSLILAAGFSVCFTANRAICRAPESRSSARLRPSEFPGAVFILLAGPSYRRQLRAVLAARREAAAGTLERAPEAGGFQIIGDVEYVACQAGEGHEFKCYECGAGTFTFSNVRISRCPACGRNALGLVAPRDPAPRGVTCPAGHLRAGGSRTCPECEARHRERQARELTAALGGVTFEEFSQGMKLLGDAIRNGLSSGDDSPAS